MALRNDDILHWRRRRHTSSHTREVRVEAFPEEAKSIMVRLAEQVKLAKEDAANAKIEALSVREELEKFKLALAEIASRYKGEDE